MPNGLEFIELMPINVISGRGTTEAVVAAIKEFLAAETSNLGPELFTGDVWRYVFENGTGNLEADLHLLHHFVDVLVTRDPDSDYVIVQALSPSVHPHMMLDAPYIPSLLRAATAALEDPVQWVFLTGNRPGMMNRPMGTFFRHIDVTTDLMVKPKDLSTSQDDGNVQLGLNGFQSVEAYLKPYTSQLQNRLFEAINGSDDELTDVARDLVSLPAEVITLFEMEFGPYSKLYEMAQNSLQVRVGERNKALRSSYRTYADKYSSVSGPLRKFPFVTITYLDEPFDFALAEVKATCETCKKCDYTVDDRIQATGVVPADEFFA